MGRKNRYKSLTKLTETERLVVKFLKKEGEYGYFINDEGKKFTAHKSHVFGTLEWMSQNSRCAVRKAGLIAVTNKRKVVSNCPEWFTNKTKEAPKAVLGYSDASKVQVISSKHESNRMRLPIGVQYTWFGMTEKVKVGDYVMTYTTSEHNGWHGWVSGVSDESSTCLINGKRCLTREIGYKIMNPLFLRTQNQEQLALN